MGYSSLLVAYTAYIGRYFPLYRAIFQNTAVYHHAYSHAYQPIATSFVLWYVSSNEWSCDVYGVLGIIPATDVAQGQWTRFCVLANWSLCDWFLSGQFAWTVGISATILENTGSLLYVQMPMSHASSQYLLDPLSWVRRGFPCDSSLIMVVSVVVLNRWWAGALKSLLLCGWTMLPEIDVRKCSN